MYVSIKMYLIRQNKVVACKEREVVFLACLYGHGVKAVVLHSESCPSRVVVIMSHTLYVQAHVVRIIGMERFLLFCLKESERMSWADGAPCGAWSPSVAV